ncbi:hypothetical protein ABID14_000222 [Peptoniphilus olsenii]|uniref:Uncharacterized protein n=1 Tax=Peptoniphilus olsenii TaxID=411570 RepID=A0ABV2J746_9FIRM
MKTLIRRLKTKNPKIYITRNGIRDFEILDYAEINLFEEKREIKVLGDKKCLTRSNKISIVLTDPIEELPTIGDSFSLEVDLKRSDGIYERIYINSIIPINIKENGEWEFEIDPRVLDWSRFI